VVGHFVFNAGGCPVFRITNYCPFLINPGVFRLSLINLMSPGFGGGGFDRSGDFPGCGDGGGDGGGLDLLIDGLFSSFCSACTVGVSMYRRQPLSPKPRTFSRTSWMRIRHRCIVCPAARAIFRGTGPGLPVAQRAFRGTTDTMSRILYLDFSVRPDSAPISTDTRSPGPETAQIPKSRQIRINSQQSYEI